MPLEGMKLLARLPVRHPCELVRSPGDQKLSVTGKLDRIDHVAVDVGKMLEHGFLGQVPDNDFPRPAGVSTAARQELSAGTKSQCAHPVHDGGLGQITPDHMVKGPFPLEINHRGNSVLIDKAKLLTDPSEETSGLAGNLMGLDPFSLVCARP